MTRMTLKVATLALAAMAGAAQAQIAVRDAETGALRAPTAEEAAALSNASQPTKPTAALRTTAAPQMRVMPNGAVSAAVPESLMTYSVARVGANGKVERECVTGEDGVARAMQGRKPFAEPFKPAAVTSMTTARGAKYELQ